MKAAQLLLKALENEGVEYIFGVPGEENLALMDALLDDSKIKFITTRHEQGAAFMADVYGRLTNKAGVCLATLGPGATNLITGVADANMDYAPIVAIAGQASTKRLHKVSHQVLDLVNLFEPITKYSVSITTPEIIPEVVAKSFNVAETEPKGCSFIEFPENIADMASDAPLLPKLKPVVVEPNSDYIEQAAELINAAKFPIIMVGNGVIRNHAAKSLKQYAKQANIPVANTFMAKGVMPYSEELSLGTVGLQASDYASCGFNRADVIITVGFDIVEYQPHLWHQDKHAKIIHISTTMPEVDEHYPIAVNVLGDINIALTKLKKLTTKRKTFQASALRQVIVEEINANEHDNSYPIKPQKILLDLRKVLNPEDIIICDVGAHKMWTARMYQAQEPNTCIISNGFASMGISLPGSISAKLLNPNKTVISLTGDAGFLMNVQELETIKRLNLAIIVLIWNDNSYGLIKWKQENEYGRTSHVDFTNPDFVNLAKSFGGIGYKIEKTEDFIPTLKKAIKDNTLVIIDCPVDYSENLKLTEKLGKLVCPV